MSHDHDSVRNYYEDPVRDRVRSLAPEYPALQGEVLLDVYCVALNRLPPRYIRHAVDLAFYMSEKERAENERAIDEAVQGAFQFVQARVAMRARS
jgi:hypothetical protein